MDEENEGSFSMLELFFWVIIVIAIIQIADCSSSSVELEVEEPSYEVWFTFPNNDKENYIGTTKGLDSCEFIARSYADSNILEYTNEWDYTCCLVTKDSSCAEKHK